MATGCFVSVATNERGYRIGQYHQNAKHDDETVDRARALHEDAAMGYGCIAKLLGVPKGLIAEWCRYEKRADSYINWKTLKVAK